MILPNVVDGHALPSGSSANLQFDHWQNTQSVNRPNRRSFFVKDKVATRY